MPSQNICHDDWSYWSRWVVLRKIYHLVYSETVLRISRCRSINWRQNWMTVTTFTISINVESIRRGIRRNSGGLLQYSTTTVVDIVDMPVDTVVIWLKWNFQSIRYSVNLWYNDIPWLLYSRLTFLAISYRNLRARRLQLDCYGHSSVSTVRIFA